MGRCSCRCFTFNKDTYFNCNQRNTSQERFFRYQRWTAAGCSMPNWLTSPGKVFLKRHVRSLKFEPLVDEVDLLEANPNYAHIRHSNGRESTVSLCHLAPLGSQPEVIIEHSQSNDFVHHDNINEYNRPIDEPPNTENTPIEDIVETDGFKNFGTPDKQSKQYVRRSERVKKVPNRLDL